MRNLYKVLGVDSSASLGDICSAYRRELHLLKTDISHHDEMEMETLRTRLNEAYLVLSKPHERRLYDMELKESHHKPPLAGSHRYLIGRLFLRPQSVFQLAFHTGRLYRSRWLGALVTGFFTAVAISGFMHTSFFERYVDYRTLDERAISSEPNTIKPTPIESSHPLKTWSDSVHIPASSEGTTAVGEQTEIKQRSQLMDSRPHATSFRTLKKAVIRNASLAHRDKQQGRHRAFWSGAGRSHEAQVVKHEPMIARRAFARTYGLSKHFDTIKVSLIEPPRIAKVLIDGPPVRDTSRALYSGGGR